MESTYHIGQVALPESDIRFIACELGQDAEDQVMAAMSVIGLSEAALCWAEKKHLVERLTQQAERLRPQSDDLMELLAPPSPELAAAEAELAAAMTEQEKAWKPIAGVINECRQHLGMGVIREMEQEDDEASMS